MPALVKFISRVPKPLTCSLAVTAQKAISPKPCWWKGLYVMPPTTLRFRRTMATERCRRSSTKRAMYSRGMLGSCLEKMFFSAINLCTDQKQCSTSLCINSSMWVKVVSMQLIGVSSWTMSFDCKVKVLTWRSADAVWL